MLRIGGGRQGQTEGGRDYSELHLVGSERNASGHSYNKMISLCSSTVVVTESFISLHLIVSQCVPVLGTIKIPL